MKTNTYIFTALAASLLAGNAAAQQFPSRNMQTIVPYAPGGSIDVMTRAVMAELSKALGRNIVVDNRPGASGMIGTELITKADPDGHILLGHTSSYPGTAAIRAKLPFDPARAIVPVAGIGKSSLVLVVHPSLPVKTVKEFVELAKKNPGKLNYGSTGIGGNNHFAGTLFDLSAGTKMIHVPYKGISLAMTAVASGEVEVVIASSAAVNPQLRAGRVRALGMSGAKPSALLPGLPAIAQAGLPGYEYELWWGIFAPAAIPADRLNFLNATINKLLNAPELKKFLEQESAEPWIATPQQLADLLPKEIARYKKIATAANIPLQ
ncbi:MAG: tripartite tricarboxylate transporter substrate binding protein [Burkholderiales bacterium]